MVILHSDGTPVRSQKKCRYVQQDKPTMTSISLAEATHKGKKFLDAAVEVCAGVNDQALLVPDVSNAMDFLKLVHHECTSATARDHGLEDKCGDGAIHALQHTTNDPHALGAVCEFTQWARESNTPRDSLDKLDDKPCEIDLQIKTDFRSEKDAFKACKMARENGPILAHVCGESTEDQALALMNNDLDFGLAAIACHNALPKRRDSPKKGKPRRNVALAQLCDMMPEVSSTKQLIDATESFNNNEKMRNRFVAFRSGFGTGRERRTNAVRACALARQHKPMLDELCSIKRVGEHAEQLYANDFDVSAMVTRCQGGR